MKRTSRKQQDTFETLIRAWPRLKDWLAEAREFEHWYRRISDRATSWNDGGEDKEPLLSGKPLMDALVWRKQRADKLNVVVANYVSRSEAWDSKNKQIKRQERHRRNQEAFDANCRLASVIMELDRFERADRLLKQCQRGDEGITDLQRIKHGLLASALALRWAPAIESPLLYEDRPAIAADPQDQRIAIAEPFGRVVIKSAAPKDTGLTREVHLGDPAVSLAFTQDGNSLLCAQASILTQLDASTGVEQRRCRPKLPEGAALRQVAFSPDGRRLCVLIGRSSLRVYRVDDSGRLRCDRYRSLPKLEDDTVEPEIAELGLAFLGNDRLAVLTESGLLVAHDLRPAGTSPTPLLSAGVNVTCMSASPSGAPLVAVDEHRRLHHLTLGDADDERKLRNSVQPELTFQPYAIAVAAPDLLLAVADDGRLHLIDLASGWTLRILTGHTAASSVTTALGKTTGLSADADGKLFRWGVELPDQWAYEFADTVVKLMLDVENDRLLVGLESGEVVERRLPHAKAMREFCRIEAPSGERALARAAMGRRGNDGQDGLAHRSGHTSGRGAPTRAPTLERGSQPPESGQTDEQS